MIIGLDYHNTITLNERFFSMFAGALIAGGFQVHIISALKNPCDPKHKREVERCRVPHTSIQIVYFKDYQEIPQLKYAACRRLGVKLMIDDMPSVCKLLAKNKIMTMQVK